MPTIPKPSDRAGLLDGANDSEVVLTRYLRQALEVLNPNLPADAYENAVREIVQVTTAKSTLQINQEKYELLRNGVKVTFRSPRGGVESRTLRVFDFDSPESNHFLAVRELWIQGTAVPQTRRCRRFRPMAYRSCSWSLRTSIGTFAAPMTRTWPTTRTPFPTSFITTPSSFWATASMRSIGSYTAPYEFFREWKRLDEAEPGVVNMETLLKGVCTKSNFIDLFRKLRPVRR